MNCRNCGAPGAAKVCAYCTTPVSVPAPAQNEFWRVERAMKTFMYDSDRLRTLRTLNGTFTAGQAIRLLSMFMYDSDRLRAARHLAPRVVNPELLPDAGRLFMYDSDRSRFLALCFSLCPATAAPPTVSPGAPTAPPDPADGAWVTIATVLFTSSMLLGTVIMLFLGFWLLLAETR